MRKKRIDGALASIPVQNGQVLKGEHLAILREVLSAAINENKFDIDRIISADPDAIHVYGDNVEALNDYVSENPEVEDKTFGFLHTSYGVEMYEYNEGTDSWRYLGELSLKYILSKLNQPRRLTSPDSTVWELQESIDNNGVVTSTWVPVE